MTAGSTLEYGYNATGRHDEPTRLVPANDPEPRNTSVPAQEGLQIEKIVRGMYTGNFNFEFRINRPTGTFPFVTGTTGGLFRFQITNTGRYLAEDGISGAGATNPQFGFLDSTSGAQIGSLGMYKIYTVNNRLFFAVGPTIMELRQTTGTARQMWVYSGAQGILPQIGEAGGITDGPSIGVYWSQGAGQTARVALSAIDSGAQGNISVAAFRPVADLNTSWPGALISGTIARATSGTHPDFALLELAIMDDGPQNSGLVTNSSTLLIRGAPAPDPGLNRITNLYALLVRKNPELRTTGEEAGGLVRFEDRFEMVSSIGTINGQSRTIGRITGTIGEAGGGNHPRLSLWEFIAPTINNGLATTTDTTTVYIDAAPNLVGMAPTGKNRALWVAGGETELAGVVTVGGLATFAVLVTITTGGLTITAGGLRVTAGGILVTLGGCDVTGVLFVRTDRGLDLRGQTDQAGAAAGTLNNAPAAGNPAIWVPVVVNGVNRAVPAW